MDSDDVYINVSHGLSVGEPAVDLAIAAAMLSSDSKKSLGHALFLGEISLTGTIKPVAHLEKRIEEAKKLGFKQIHVPTLSLQKKNTAGLEIISHDSILSLVQWIRNI